MAFLFLLPLKIDRLHKIRSQARRTHTSYSAVAIVPKNHCFRFGDGCNFACSNRKQVLLKLKLNWAVASVTITQAQAGYALCVMCTRVVVIYFGLFLCLSSFSLLYFSISSYSLFAFSDIVFNFSWSCFICVRRCLFLLTFCCNLSWNDTIR